MDFCSRKLGNLLHGGDLVSSDLALNSSCKLAPCRRSVWQAGTACCLFHPGPPCLRLCLTSLPQPPTCSGSRAIPSPTCWRWWRRGSESGGTWFDVGFACFHVVVELGAAWQLLLEVVETGFRVRCGLSGCMVLCWCHTECGLLGRVSCRVRLGPQRQVRPTMLPAWAGPQGASQAALGKPV